MAVLLSRCGRQSLLSWLPGAEIVSQPVKSPTEGKNWHIAARPFVHFIHQFSRVISLCMHDLPIVRFFPRTVFVLWRQLTSLSLLLVKQNGRGKKGMMTITVFVCLMHFSPRKRGKTREREKKMRTYAFAAQTPLPTTVASSGRLTLPNQFFL